MKVLVAQQPTSPRSAGDVWSAMPEEVVVAPFVCTDRGCGCDCTHQGLISHGFTTEMLVRDVDTTSEALTVACRVHLDASQWAAAVEGPSELDVVAGDLIEAMCQAAQQHGVGTLLRATFDSRSGRWIYHVAPTEL